MNFNSVQQVKEPIAIVGMSCRFPQSNSLKEFWQLLLDRKDAISEIPLHRWDSKDYYDPDPNAAKKTNQQHAALLENIHHFDPLFFNISPAEAIEMNPSQKLMLELTWEAIENSGIPYKNVQGKKTGVYVGNIWSDFEHLRKQKNADITTHSALGQSSNIIANRVSFSFGFTGPSLVVDTGCSSSLVALHLACQSLWDNSTEMAVAAGVNHLMDPDQYVFLTKFGGLSSNGKCKTFDIEADGFVRGEGAGVLLLKTLKKAEQDGDKILALIRGTAINNNGYNVNLPATSVAGQKQMLEDAYRESGIHPKDVHYVEAHGTGTKVGDPTESNALGEFFGAERGNSTLRLGSVKTNIGHLEAAAGIAGLIKVVLAMNNKVLPSNLNFKTPNPEIRFEALKLQVQSATTPWPLKNGETMKAGVNSFGWGGTNAHTVIEEYRPIKNELTPNKNITSRLCLPLSAKSSSALEAYIKLYITAIEEASSEEEFESICVASALSKPEFDYRVVVTATSKNGMLASLKDFLEDVSNTTPQKLRSVKNKVVMIFPGQGSQWLGMGKDLFVKEPVFARVIEECDKAFKDFTDWSLIDQLNADADTSRLSEINVIQPMLFAMQIALAKLWISWGVHPDAVVGHSMGEVAAAHISGVLTLEDAARIICTRSTLMRTVSNKGGAMMVTELSLADAEKFVKQYPQLSIAVSNSPKSTVLAGDQSAIDEALKILESQNLFCRQVKVDVASHSQQMDPLKQPLQQALHYIKPQAASIPILSTVKNKFMRGEEMDAEYWVNNLREPVQFSTCMKELIQSGHTVFIEVSPHPVLTNAVNECAQFAKAEVLSISSLVRDKPEHDTLFKNFNDLYSGGYNVHWEKFYKTHQVPRVELPGYPFQRESYEIEDKSSELYTTKNRSAHPLLGNPIHLAGIENVFFWETQLNLEAFTYLKDRTSGESSFLPESIYVEIALEAAAEVFNTKAATFIIHRLRYLLPVNFKEKRSIALQIKLTRIAQKRISLQFFVRENNPDTWSLVAEGEIHTREKKQEPLVIPGLAQIQPQDSSLSAESFYQTLKKVGLEYGEYFKGVDAIEFRHYEGHTIVHFTGLAHQKIHRSVTDYKIHPALLDCFFQPLFSFVAANNKTSTDNNTAFITSIMEVQLLKKIDVSKTFSAAAILCPTVTDEKGVLHLEADITVWQDDEPVLNIAGLKGKVEIIKTANTKQKLDTSIIIKSIVPEKEAIEAMLIGNIAQVIKLNAKRIAPTMSFKSLGIDSMMAVQLKNSLEKNLNLKLSVAWFWSYPTIKEYSEFLKNQFDSEDIVKNDHSINAVLENYIDSSTAPNWFVINKHQPKAKVKVFCFHDAGGSSSLFYKWDDLFDTSYEIIAVELPGRGKRMAENYSKKHSEIVENIVTNLFPLLNTPYVIAGHSMGAILAFEVIKMLDKLNHMLPMSFLASSAPGPAEYNGMEIPYDISEEKLTHIFPHINFDSIGDKEMHQLLVTRLRADLQVLNSYSYTHTNKLSIPIVALHGSEDKRILSQDVRKWESETTSNFQFLSRPGGHDFIQFDKDFIANLIVQKISFSKTELAPL